MCMCMYLFEVERVVQVRHDQLDESFEARKRVIEAAAPGGADGSPSAERVHNVFHGTPRRLLAAILRNGLLPGKPSSNQGDRGFWGDSARGVYVAQHPDTTFYYCAAPGSRPSNNQDADGAIPPPDRMAIIMLECVLGRSQVNMPHGPCIPLSRSLSLARPLLDRLTIGCACCDCPPRPPTAIDGKGPGGA